MLDWEACIPVTECPQLDQGTTSQLLPSDRLTLSAEWRLGAFELPVNSTLLEHIRTNHNPWQAWLDMDRIQLPLTLRSRRPGDRFFPFGLGGHSLKISDYMINVRMPRHVRKGYPLVLSGETIVWVPGHGIGQSAALLPDSKRALYLAMINERRIDTTDPALS